MREVFLHVGPPKTGSTFLQRLLWDHRDDLGRQGVLLPVAHANEMWLAAVDVQDGAFVHVDVPEARGAWARVTSRVRDHQGPAVLSHELLGLSTEDHVGRIAASFGDAELHVVVMARSLAAMLPSLWQETVKMADPDRSWDRFLDDERRAGSPWTDPAGIVRRWLRHLPPSRVHVVTVPPRGTGPEVLLGRFSDAVGIDARGWAIGAPANASLDAVQVELIRHLHRSAEGRIDRRSLQRLVNDDLIPRLPRSSRPRPRLPPETRPWVEEESRRRRADLLAAGVSIVGTLADLEPVADDWGSEACAVTHAELLALAIELLIAPDSDGG